MQICPKCKVNIRGEKSCCPLCQGTLKTTQGELPASFPTLKRHKISNITFLKVCTFLFIALEIIFGTVQIMTEDDIPFLGILILGTAVVWLTVVTTMYLRNNPLKVITWEVIIAIIVDVYIDMHTGFIGWSLMWMVPATLMALAIVTVVSAAIMRLRLDEYIFYIIFDLIMALVQIVFIRNGMNKFPWPAVISIMMYLIITVGLVIFRSGDLKNATAKMFNV